MLAGVPGEYWIGFHILVLFIIACDLGAMRFAASRRRRASGFPEKKKIGIGEDLAFLGFVVTMAVGFAIWMNRHLGHEAALEFASGYLIEGSLSIDNLFVFLVVFQTFKLSVAKQHRALLYGIVGAILMRGGFIFAGVALLERFSWIEFLFGGFLLFTAIRLGSKKEGKSPGRLIDWLRPREKQKGDGLLMAILAIELIDVVFALDSIPAVLAVTDKTFVAYTSNIFAVLGLRSLYFLLSDLLERLRYLHFGLAAILVFVGAKMILRRWVHVPIVISLGVILGFAAIAAAASLLHPEEKAPSRPQAG